MERMAMRAKLVTWWLMHTEIHVHVVNVVVGKDTHQGLALHDCLVGSRVKK